MIVWMVAATVILLLLILLIINIMEARREFLQVRLTSLSMAAESDVVGGVGISVLVASPRSISVVVNLLDSRYSLSEVVVVLDGEKQSNLLQHLKIRYSLVSCISEGCVVYRSRSRIYRRLVVVVEQDAEGAELYNLAAKSALFDYLMRVPSNCYLMPFAVGKVAEKIASASATEVNVITAAESGIEVWSRRYWLLCGGFENKSLKGYNPKKMSIFEPLAMHKESDKDYSLLVERSRYNFWDYFALKIMKNGNKLLSLIKPKTLL